MDYDPDKVRFEIFAELDKTVPAPVEPPDGAFTYQDIEDWRGISNDQARTWAQQLVDAGAVVKMYWKGRAYFVRVE